MDITLDELPDFLNNVAAFISDVADVAVVEVARAVDELAVDATPVDTGLARSNWIVSVGTPFEDVIDPYLFGSHLGIGERGNAEAAIAQAADALSEHKKGQVVYVQNNVDYIGELNDGSSTQAPKLFVERAIKGGIAKGLEVMQSKVHGLAIKKRS